MLWETFKYKAQKFRTASVTRSPSFHPDFFSKFNIGPNLISVNESNTQ